MTAAKPVTLGKAADAYLASIRVPETVKSRKYFLKAMRAEFGDTTPLADITARDAARWIERQWGKMSTGTQNIRISAWRDAAAWWEKQGWVADGYAEAAAADPVRPKVTDVRPAEPPTTEEVRAMLATFSGKYPTGIRNKALVMLLARSGLRISEALALAPADIDFTDHAIRLRTTKSGKAQVRGFHPSADDALHHWIGRRKAEGINGHHRLFCTLKGEPLDDAYVRRMLAAAARKAGVTRRVHPHGLRARFAIELQNSGVEIDVIGALLGQDALPTTVRYLRKLTNAQALGVLAKANLASLGGEQAEPEPGDVQAQLAELTRMVKDLQKGAGQ